MNANDLAAALYAYGQEAEARRWYERALDLWKTIPDHVADTGETMLGLSNAYRATGDLAAAEKILRAAPETGIDSEHRAGFQNALADILREEDRIPESRALFEATLRLTPISNQRRIEVLLGLSDLDRRERRLSASLEEAKKAIELSAIEGSATLQALGLRELGLTLVSLGDLGGAEPPLHRSLALFGQDAAHPRQIATTLSCLGAVYREQNKYSLAEDAWLKALGMFARSGGKEHPQTAVIMESLSELYSAERRFDEARRLAEHALAIMRRATGPRSAPAAGALAALALVEQRQTRKEAAADMYSDAVGMMRESNAMSDEIAAVIMSRYAAALHRTQEAKQVRAELKAFHAR